MVTVRVKVRARVRVILTSALFCACEMQIGR